MQEKERIRRIRQGEKELLDPLVDQYYQDIFRFCYYRTGEEQSAYDCTQETFLRMLRFLENCVETRNFKGYLLRIALNVCRDHYRAGSRMAAPLPEDETEMRYAAFRAGGYRGENGRYMEGGAAADGESAYRRVEDENVIQKCLLQLPEFQREVIILHFYYGYKVREIASVTGVPLPTAKSRLKQGLDKLRKIFREEGIDGENW